MLDRPHYAYKVDMVGNVLSGQPEEPEPATPLPPRPPSRQEALTH
jgi:hypothetical protein